MGQKLLKHLFLCLLKICLLISHGLSQQAKGVPIALTLSGRLDDFPGCPKGTVSVRCIHISLFHGKGGGQKDVRIHGRICHEPLMDHRK